MGGRRRVWGGLTALALITAGLVAASTSSAYSAVGDSGSDAGSPVFATAGDGRFKDRIGWLSWGAEGANIANGATARSWQQTGSTERVEVICTLSSRSTAGVRAYRPGAYAADGLTRLYRSASAASLVSALATNGASNSFRVTCNARLATYASSAFTGTPSVVPVTLAGLVFADAESTNGSETIQITPTNGDATRWRVIDRYAGTCSSEYRARRTDHVPTWPWQTPDWRNRLTLSASGECSGTNAYSATAAVFGEGGTQFDVALAIGGEQAVSIGYVLGADFADAPASYGSAAALVQPTWSGGEMSNKNSTYTIAGPGAITPAAITAPAARIGPQAFTNMSVPHSTQADGDTGWAVPNPNGSITPTADEDAFTSANSPSSVTIVAGDTAAHTVSDVRCSSVSGTYVRGWIDWNRNGAFDSTEGSTPANGVACPAGGSVSLSFTVPSGVPEGSDPAGDLTYLRLQATTTRTQLASPTTTLVEGEVEDWPLRLRVPRLVVTKTADVAGAPAAGGVVTYTVTLSNTGNGDLATAYVYDAYAGVHDDAAVGGATASAPGTSGQDTTNHVLWWSGAVAAGAQVTFTIPFTMRAGDPGNLVLTNVARVSTTSLSTAQQTATCTVGSAEQQAGRCAVSQLFRVGVEVTKRAYVKQTNVEIADGAQVAPGTVVVWRYTVRNTGSIALSGIQLTDVATDTRTDANGPVTATTSAVITCSGSPAVIQGTTVTIPTLAAGAQRVCQAEGVIGGT